jgi:hypothetical protein
LTFVVTAAPATGRFRQRARAEMDDIHYNTGLAIYSVMFKGTRMAIK